MLLKGLTCSPVRFFSHHCNCTYGHTVDTTLLAYIPHQTLASSLHIAYTWVTTIIAAHYLIKFPQQPAELETHYFVAIPPYLLYIRKPLSIREPLFGQALSGQAVVGEQRTHGIGHCTMLTGA